MSLIKIPKIYPVTFKPLIILAIETIKGKSKRPDIDAIDRHISKSEATSIDCHFIASVLNDLENQNVIYNKPTTQSLDSYFIASHTDKKDPKSIKSQAQNDNTQSDPESNLFSNQPGHDLVSPDDTTPIVNSTVIAWNTKEFPNIKTHEPLLLVKLFLSKMKSNPYILQLLHLLKKMTWILKTAKTMI